MPIEDQSRAGAARPRWLLLFSPITTFAEAKKVARRAAIVALIFAVMDIIGIYVMLHGISTITGRPDPEITDFVRKFVVVFGVTSLLLILFLAWRINTGRGFVSAAFLLVWFVGETATKVIGGSAGFGFGLAFLVMALFLIDGVRATWRGSELAKLPDQAQIGVFD